MVFNQKLNPFSFQIKSGSTESTSFDSIYKNALFIFLLIFLSTNTFAQKNIIKVDTAIHYEKVILYACGEEIGILKGEDEYRIGNCGFISSIVLIGVDISKFLQQITFKYSSNKGQILGIYKKEDYISASLSYPINSTLPGTLAQY